MNAPRSERLMPQPTDQEPTADDELQMLATAVARFLEQEASPSRTAAWREAGCVERDFWRKAGEMGFLGVSVPEEYGGGGGDFRHDAVLIDQVARREVSGFAIALHNGVVTPYVVAHGTEEQKRRWLPRLCSGELIAAVAMSEPEIGSDLQRMRTVGRRDGDGFRIKGVKTFITNGQLANLVVVAVKTDPTQGAKGISLLVLETDDAQGFQRGRKIDKIGCEAQDTSELFFDDVWVPRENLLGGREGCGFEHLMAELPRERLVIAIQSLAMLEVALDETIAYTKERQAFGRPIFEFQNTQFKLAEAKTGATIARVFLDQCIKEVLDGSLSGARAAMAKYWISELQNRVIDDCLQLHGAYGYTNEFRIGRMYRDARVSRIYGGSNEIMRLLIARSL
jgi:alkylation response protein AidB-like acyl-CoA dehydrogenase